MIFRTHVIIWVVYTLYFSYLVKYFYNIPLSFAFIVQTILHKIGDVFLFYMNVYWILPRFFSWKKSYLFIFSSVFIICCYIFYRYSLEFYIFQILQITIPNDIPVLNQIISQAIIGGSNFIIFSLGYYFSQRVIQQQKEISQQEVEIATQKLVLIKKEIELAEEKEKNAILAKEKAQAEMAFLRAQINPHFLFNTLNLIYGKIITSTKEIAGDLILEFSSMMQYATSTKMQEDTVDVSGELEFLQRYLKMFKARNQHNANIDYEEEGYFGSHRVVPMVLITIVENALKHGLVDDPNNPLISRTSLIDDFFVFMVSNPKNPYPNDIAGKGNTGVGIPNIIKRLDAVYKDGGFTLESEDLKDDYIVTFTVNYNNI
jgi:two-component system LytT family sensor kinase